MLLAKALRQDIQQWGLECGGTRFHTRLVKYKCTSLRSNGSNVALRAEPYKTIQKLMFPLKPPWKQGISHGISPLQSNPLPQQHLPGPWSQTPGVKSSRCFSKMPKLIGAPSTMFWILGQTQKSCIWVYPPTPADARGSAPGNNIYIYKCVYIYIYVCVYIICNCIILYI